LKNNRREVKVRRCRIYRRKKCGETPYQGDHRKINRGRRFWKGVGGGLTARPRRWEKKLGTEIMKKKGPF